MGQTVACEPLPIYSTLGDDPELAELVELFVSEIPNRLAQLTKQLETRNWPEAYRIAHQLKGAAGSYGFDPVTPVAERLESLVRQQEAEDRIHSAADALIAICHRMHSGPTPASQSSV